MTEQDETLEIFFAETDDLLKISEESLLRLEASPEIGPDLEELFRAVHTLKSGSAMVGFNHIAEYSHLVENLLDRLREGQLSITKNLISFLLEGIDFIRSMVDQCARGETEVEPEVFEAKKGQVSRFLGMDGLPEEAVDLPESTADLPVESDNWHYYNIDLLFKRICLIRE